MTTACLMGEAEKRPVRDTSKGFRDAISVRLRFPASSYPSRLKNDFSAWKIQRTQRSKRVTRKTWWEKTVNVSGIAVGLSRREDGRLLLFCLSGESTSRPGIGYRVHSEYWPTN